MATVDHWAAVGTAGSRARLSRAARLQALETLISWRWVIGEVGVQGLRISETDIRARLERRERGSFPGGHAEMEAFLHATGETLGDLTLEAESEVASQQLRRLIATRVPRISRVTIASYYRRHRQSFFVPERLELAITNRKTSAEAERLRRQVESDRGLLRGFQHEVRGLPTNPRAGGRPRLEAAMRAAAPHTLVGPVKQRVLGTVSDYFVFEVERVIPARYLTLSQVQGAVRGQLEHQAQRRTRSAFLSTWSTRWIARTDCSRGYVVRGCRQYRGRMVPHGQFGLE